MFIKTKPVGATQNVLLISLTNLWFRLGCIFRFSYSSHLTKINDGGYMNNYFENISLKIIKRIFCNNIDRVKSVSQIFI